MANDALDYGNANTTRYFSLSGPALPDADWCIGFWMRRSRAGSNAYDYAISRGTLGGNNSLHIFMGGSSDSGVVFLRALGSSGTEFNNNPPSSPVSVGSTDILVVIQRRSSAIEFYLAEEDATVSAPTYTNSSNVPNGISAGTWYIGSRADLNTSRMWENPLGEVFALTGDYLTAAEVETLAAGAHITAVKSTRAFDLRFRGSNATESDLSGNGRDATRSTGTGFTLVNEFFPDSSGTTVSSVLEAISLSTLPATISSNRDIASALESLLLSANQAQVSSDRAVAGQTEAIALTANAAQISSDRSIAGALESLALSTFPASLNSEIAANTEAMTLSTFLSVVSSDRSIIGAVESLTLQTNPASVSVGSQIAAGVEALTLQAQPADISLNVSLTAQLQSIVLTELAAQVSLSSNIDAQLESLVLTPHGATLTLDNGLQAELEALTLTPFNAILTLPTTEILAPGLEFTLTENRLQFTLPVNRLHFTFRS